MKIYLFNPETGIYQGEDFTDNKPMCQGRETVPAHATPIAPPPFRRGEVPFFAVTENRWEIRPVAALVAGGCGDPCDHDRREPKRQSFPQTF
jgi:hypothetical protein